tara:strand:+ start:490 stop:1014 length:525 start_codon:yes stop_codon:yes gene_type:complete
MYQKDIKTKLKQYFFLNPTKKLRVRQIEREVKIPLPSVTRYVKELIKENFLKKETITNIIAYSADRTSETYLLEKKLFNIKQLQSLKNYLKQELSNPTIIVFGSFARGEDVEISDIDIYVETSLKKQPILNNFEQQLQRTIQLFLSKSIHDITNKELANNIINGITLNGFMEVL